ncbi:hypothetical protein [Mucilaginibacter sp.]
MTKTLLVINDSTPQGYHAAKFALLIAHGLKANILIANVCKTVKNIHTEKVFAGANGHDDELMYNGPDTTESLIMLSNDYEDFKPGISEVDVSAFDEAQLAELSNKKHVWMIIKGMADHSPETLSKMHIDINTLMNKVRCPLLMVPLHWPLKQIERLVYIADLRYCRLHFVRFLVELAKPWNAIVSIANLAAKGLPDMSNEYATAVFNDEIYGNVKYDHLYLNTIKEKDLTKAVDVLINGMHNDVLVMVNHRFHFEKIVGRYITHDLPDHITVPLLIFPY